MEQLGGLTVTLLPQGMPLGQTQRGAPPGSAAPSPQAAFRGLLLQALLGGQGQAGPPGMAGQAGSGEARTPLAPVAVVPPGLGQQARKLTQELTQEPEPAQAGEAGQPKAAATAQPLERAAALLAQLMEEQGLKIQDLPVPLRNLLQVSAPIPAPAPDQAPATSPVLESAPAPAPAPDADGPAAPPDQAQMVQALAALIIQVLQAAGVQQAAGQNPAPGEADAAAPAPLVTPASVPQLGEAQLERFVQLVTRLLPAEGSSSPAPDGAPAEAPAEAPQRPTFEQLVRLISGEEAQPAAKVPQIEPKAEAKSEPKAPTKAEPAVELKAPLRAESKPEVKADPAPQAPVAPKTVHLEQPTAPAQVPDRPQADPDQVVRQAARFLKVTLEGQRSEVRFQLQPEHLGTVAVKLVLNEGAVKASMTAADPAVKAVLEANLEQLRSRLSDQGFRVEQIQVAVGGGNTTGQQAQQGHQGQGQQPATQQGWRQGRQEQGQNQQNDAEPVPQRPAAHTWLPGRKGARIDSLA